MSYLPNNSIITNLSYETTNKIIEEYKKIFVESGKCGRVVNQESKLLTPIVYQVVLKNKARVFVQFKIYLNSPTNHTLKIKVSFPHVLSHRTEQKLTKVVNAVLNTVQEIEK